MELFNYIFLTAVYVVPLCSLLYLASRREELRRRLLPIHGTSVFLLMAALGIARLATFISSDSASYSLPGFTVSRDLEFAFSVSQERVWIFLGLAVALFSHFLFYPLLLKKQRKQLLAYVYLIGAYGAACFCIFSEKILVSIMFIEIAAFFLHAFSLLSDDDERELERVSYFKRNVFIFSGLFLMLGLSITGVFDDSTIILAGLTLYTLSLICGRHTFRNVANFFILQIALFLSAYIFWRTFQLNIESGDWLLHGLIYLSLAITFALISFTRTQRLASFYWYSLAIVCGYFALKMGSHQPGASGLLVEDVLLVMTLGAFILLMLSKVFLRKSRGRYFSHVVGVLMFAAHISCLVVPETLVGQIFFSTKEYNLLFVIPYFLFVFLITASAIRLIWGPSYLDSLEASAEDAGKIVEFVPAVLLVVILAVNITFSHGIINIGDFLPVYVSGEMTEESILLLSVFLSVVLFGTILGTFVPRSNFFVNHLKKREAKTEDFFPRIDPIFLRLAEGFVNSPLKIQEQITVRLGRGLGWVSEGIIKGDREIVRGRILQEIRALFNSLSFFVRFIHGGYAKAYIFYAMAVFAVVVMVFFIK